MVITITHEYTGVCVHVRTYTKTDETRVRIKLHIHTLIKDSVLIYET